jgi:hypothetical protein
LQYGARVCALTRRSTRMPRLRGFARLAGRRLPWFVRRHAIPECTSTGVRMTLPQKVVLLGSVAIVASAMCQLTPAQEKRAGQWQTSGDFVRNGTEYRQRWICVPSGSTLEYQMMDYDVLRTPPQNTQGACSLGEYPALRCTVCRAPRPRDRCEWWVEKQKLVK